MMSLVLIAVTGEAVHFAEMKWQKVYETKKSADYPSGLAIDSTGNHGYMCGSTVSERTSDASLEGKLPEDKRQKHTKQYTGDFEDGIVARFSRSSGELQWVYRKRDDDGNSRFSSISFSGDGKRVYVGGFTSQSKTSVAPLISVLDAETGELIATKTLDTKSRGFVTALTVSEKSVFVCGRESGANTHTFMGRKDDDKANGGVFVARLEDEGTSLKLKWTKQGGANRLSDYCSDIKLGGKEHLIVAATVFPERSSGSQSPPTGMIRVFNLDPTSSKLRWITDVQRSETVEDIAVGIHADDNAVYVGGSKWTDRYNGKRMMMHKISIEHGHLVWDRKGMQGLETCCRSLKTKLGRSANFPGAASSEPAGGLVQWEDGRIYQVGYMRQKKDNVKDRYSLVLARMNTFGSQDGDHDINYKERSSDEIETFQYVSNKPRFVSSDIGGSRLYVLSNGGNPEGDDAAANEFKISVYAVEIDSSKTHVPLARSGKHYVRVSFQIPSVFTSVERTLLQDIIADRMEIASAQVQVFANDELKTSSRMSKTLGSSSRIWQNATDIRLLVSSATHDSDGAESDRRPQLKASVRAAQATTGAMTVVVTMFCDEQSECKPETIISLAESLLDRRSSDQCALESALDLRAGGTLGPVDAKVLDKGESANLDDKSVSSLGVESSGSTSKELSSDGSTETSSKKGGAKIGVIVGAVCGALAGLILVVVIGVFAMKSSSRRTSRSRSDAPTSAGTRGGDV